MKAIIQTDVNLPVVKIKFDHPKHLKAIAQHLGKLSIDFAQQDQLAFYTLTEIWEAFIKRANKNQNTMKLKLSQAYTLLHYIDTTQLSKYEGAIYTQIINQIHRQMISPVLPESLRIRA